MNNPLTIFLVSFDWDDLVGTKPEVIVKKLARDKLYPDKNRFLILSWGPGRYEKDIAPNIRVVRRSARLRFFRPLYDFLTIFIAPSVIRQSGVAFDLLFVYDFPFALALARAKRLFNVPLVLCLTNQPRLYINSRNSLRLPKLWYQMLVERLASKHINLLYTTSVAMQRYAVLHGIPKERVVLYIMDTITPDKALAKEARGGLLRTRFPIPREHKILLCAARLEGEKGLERLIDALAALSRKNLSLIVAGKGPSLNALLERAKARGVADRVFFPGHLSRPEMWNAYKDADLFILLSRAEALGLVFLEAMYAGLPVIGSRADGIVETIGANEERGFLWEPEDGIEALEKRIDACLTEREGEHTAQAKAHVEEKMRNTTDIYTVYQLCKGQ
ncbi:MAG: glycosyltransferase family 4 protein [Candidatus Adlerbacteria bacterium]|nr:glycosyltransferase family 4 protein [Candidatus Adlerbacteria bacterium]